MVNTKVVNQTLSDVITDVVRLKKKYPRKFTHGSIDMTGLEIMTLRCNLMLVIIDRMEKERK